MVYETHRRRGGQTWLRLVNIEDVFQPTLRRNRRARRSYEEAGARWQRQERGLVVVAQRVKAELGRIEQATQALVEAVEADDREDQSRIREQLGEIRKDVSSTLEKVKALLERVRGIGESAGQRKEIVDDFTCNLESLVEELGEAFDALNPGNWEE